MQPRLLSRQTAEVAFQFDNQRLCIDFLATVSGPSHFPIDRFRHPSDLAIWIEEAGVVGDARGLDTPELIRAKQLRHVIVEAIRQSQQPGRIVDEGTRDVLNRVASRPRPRLELHADTIVRSGGFDAALAEVAADALDLLSRPELVAAVRWCLPAICRRAFLDRSAAGQRQWCSARCRAQHSSHRYRERHRQLRNDRPWTLS